MTVRKSRHGRPYLLLPFLLLFCDSQLKMLRQMGRKQWKRGKQKGLLRRRSNSERRGGRGRKRERILICAENSLSFHHLCGSFGAVLCISVGWWGFYNEFSKVWTKDHLWFLFQMQFSGPLSQPTYQTPYGTTMVHFN